MGCDSHDLGARNFASPREYLLTYSGKESESKILLNTPALPLQRSRSYGQNGGGWENMLIQGDNLPVLRRLMEMKKDGLLKNSRRYRWGPTLLH